ncbi:MAG: RNA polymerase factor sigma-32 [Ghiorsea sp.]|nr:RNA polymerase factor sigma-32 [Ghiorsea sp.]
MTKISNDKLPVPVAGKAKSVTRYRSSELSPLDMWYRELRQIEKLNREEEAKLTKKWAEEKDLQAAQRLLLGNLHAVAAIAREYRHFGLPEMDLIQEGTIGLMKAIHRFDPERGFRLMTYASWWVRAAIHDYILKSWSIVKMGTNKMQRRIFSGLKKAKHAIAAIEGRLDEEVANEYGISGSEFQNIASSFLQRDMSLDSESEEGGGTMVMALPSPEMPPEEQVINADWQAHQSSQLHDAMADLSDRDRLIITRRHLSEDPDTLKDLAGELGISIERVRQLEARAMKKLRETMT